MTPPRPRRWSRGLLLTCLAATTLLPTDALAADAQAGQAAPRTARQRVAASTCLVAQDAEVRVATFNVNFGLRPAAVDRDLEAIKPHTDLLMAQEAKNVRLDRLLGAGWGVHQALDREDKRGSGVAWRLGPEKRNTGYRLAVRPGGAAMLTRWVSWADLRVAGRTVRFASTHRPPPRYSYRWPDFDANVSRWVHDSPHPVVLGLDSNTTHHAGLERSTGLDWSGVGVDGFLTDLPLSDVHALPKGNSDHRAVVGDLALGTQRCGTSTNG